MLEYMLKVISFYLVAQNVRILKCCGCSKMLTEHLIRRIYLLYGKKSEMMGGKKVRVKVDHRKSSNSFPRVLNVVNKSRKIVIAYYIT